MKPTDIQIIGNEMAIKWENGDESFLSLAKLRKACPCAGCKGEMDVMGNTYKGPERHTNSPPLEFDLLSTLGDMLFNLSGKMITAPAYMLMITFAPWLIHRGMSSNKLFEAVYLSG